MSTQGKILAAVAVIFFVCLVVWVVRTTPDAPPPFEEIKSPTVMEYEGNTITEERDGKIIWELTCEKLRVDPITQDMELTKITGKYYDEDKTWNLTAERGIYDRTQSLVYVEGDIVLNNNVDAEELRSDELTWLSEKEILVAEKNVSVKNEKGATLLTEKLEWFSAEDKIVAEGKIDVTNTDGAKLLCDKLEWLSAEDRLIATGNVKISKDDMRGYGDMAYAEGDFKKFGLIGNARVLKGVPNDAPID